MLEFSRPELVLLLPFFIALTLLSHYFAQKIKQSLEVFHYPPVHRLLKLIEKKGVRRSSWRGVSLALKILLMVLIAFSLADPIYLGFVDINKTAEISMVGEKDIVGGIVLAIDVSPSMGITDVKPTRLEAAKTILDEFIGNASDKVRFGVVAFEAEIKRSLALTQNKTRVISLLNELHQAEGSPCITEFTDIGFGLQTAVGLLSLLNSSNGTYVIVLLSDGYANYGAPDSIDRAINTAIKEGVPVYTVHISKFSADSDPELLKDIAAGTNGKFMNATNTEELRNVLDMLAKYDAPTNVWSTSVEIKTTVPYRIEIGHMPLFGVAVVILILWVGNYKHYKTWF